MELLFQNEHYGLESIMGREVGGDHFYYRISETPEKGSIRIDLSDEELEDAYPTGIHRLAKFNELSLNDFLAGR